MARLLARLHALEQQQCCTVGPSLTLVLKFEEDADRTAAEERHRAMPASRLDLEFCTQEAVCH